jgi:hypothetical protein
MHAEVWSSHRRTPADLDTIGHLCGIWRLAEGVSRNCPYQHVRQQFVRQHTESPCASTQDAGAKAEGGCRKVAAHLAYTSRRSFSCRNLGKADVGNEANFLAQGAVRLLASSA